MQFRVLGPLEVADGVTTLGLGGNKPRAILAGLLLHRGQPVAAERLVDLAWPTAPPPRALVSVRSYVSNLRRLLEPDRAGGAVPRRLVHTPRGYLLDVDGAVVDVATFEALAAEGRAALGAGEPATALERFDRALQLWRGEPFPELPEDDVARAEAVRLQELRLETVDSRFAAGLALGRHHDLVPELEAAVLEQPLRERRRSHLAVALYRCGRQADALQRLRDGRALLAEELALDPDPALRQLEERILRHDPALAAPAAAGDAATVLGTTTGGAHLDDGPELVGRDDEVAWLGRLARHARGGDARVALVAGEPGIGKTRLAEEAAARGARDGAVVCWGRCSSSGVAPPFWPWIQVLQALERAVGGSTHDAPGGAMARLAPSAVRRAGPTAGHVAGDIVQARLQQLHAVVADLRSSTAGRPVVLVLDDLQWADDASLELLRFLPALVREDPVLVIATYRDGEADRSRALTATLASLARDPAVDRRVLTRLTRPDVARLASAALATSPGDDLVTVLFDRTAGNPFLLGELLRLLAHRPDVDAHREVPDGVRDVVAQRLATLPVDTRQALDAGAVLGHAFTLGTLARVLEEPAGRTLDRLEAALGEGLLQVGDSLDHYAFSHVLVRDAVYGELAPGRRARLHAGAAMALEHQDAPGAQVAHHYEQASVLGYAAEAVRAATRAADQALHVFAYQQAEDHLLRGLRLLGTDGAGSRWELGLQRRLIHLRLVRDGYTSPGVRAAAARVRQLAGDTDAASLGSVLWALWSDACVRGDFHEALRLADELAGRAAATDDAWLVAAGHHSRGTTLWHLGRLEEAAEQLERAIARSAEVPPGELLAVGRQHLGILARSQVVHPLWLLGRREDAERHVRDAVGLATEFAMPYELGCAHMFDAWFAVLADDPPRALRSTRVTAALCRQHVFAQLGALNGVLAGWARAASGEPDEGVTTIREAVDVLDASGARMLRHFHLGLLADVLARAGRHDHALRTVREALDVAATSGESFHVPQLQALRARLEG